MDEEYINSMLALLNRDCLVSIDQIMNHCGLLAGPLTSSSCTTVASNTEPITFESILDVMAKLPPRNDGPTKFIKHEDTIYGFYNRDPLDPAVALEPLPMLPSPSAEKFSFYTGPTHWVRPNDPSYSKPLTAEERTRHEVKMQELREQLAEERLRREQEQLLVEKQAARTQAASKGRTRRQVEL